MFMDEYPDVNQLGHSQGDYHPAGLGKTDAHPAVALRSLTAQAVTLLPVEIMPAMPVQGRLLPEGGDCSGFQVHMLKNG